MTRTVIFLSAMLLAPALTAASDKPQQICGIVIAVTCHPTQPEVAKLLVQPGISVDVSAKTEDEAARLRPAARSLFFQQACVSGKLTARQDSMRPAQLLLDEPAAIAPNGPGPADWPVDGLDTSCDAGVTMAKAKNPRPALKYPPEAMARKVQGIAIFQALIAADGSLENLRLVKSADAQYGLDHEAAENMRRWTFEPATKNGVPIRSTLLLTTQFSLDVH